MANVADSVFNDAGRSCVECEEPVATGPQFKAGRATLCPRHLSYAVSAVVEKLETMRDLLRDGALG